MISGKEVLSGLPLLSDGGALMLGCCCGCCASHIEVKQKRMHADNSSSNAEGVREEGVRGMYRLHRDRFIVAEGCIVSEAMMIGHK